MSRHAGCFWKAPPILWSAASGWSFSGQAVPLWLLPSSTLTSTKRRVYFLSYCGVHFSCCCGKVSDPCAPGTAPAKVTSIFHVTESGGQFTVIALLDLSAALAVDTPFLLSHSLYTWLLDSTLS